MLRHALVAFVLVVSFAASPALAQQGQPPAAQPEATLIGLPVFSSDGLRVGEVTSVAKAAGKTAVRVEMGAFLGLGPSQVLVDADVFQRKGDRLELNVTAAQVQQTITQQNQKKD
jgi:PRC-barrel domain